MRFCTGTPVTSAAAETDGAGGRLLDAGHELHERRLAGKRGAEKDVEGAFLELQIGLVNVNVGADAFAEVREFERHALGRGIPEGRCRPLEVYCRIAGARQWHAPDTGLLSGSRLGYWAVVQRFTSSS